MIGTRPAVLTFLLASAPLSAHAARLPDWARPIAENAPAVEGAAASSFEARVLLSDTTVTVLPDGTFRTRRLLARQSLHPRAEGVGIDGHGFGMNSKIRTAKVWHLPPGERVERSQAPPLDIADFSTFASDRKVRQIGVDGIRRGSLVFFEFEAEEKEPTLDWSHAFFEGLPIREARLRLQLPPGWSVRHAWVRTPGPEPQAAGSTYTWTVHDLEPPPEEVLAPTAYARAPLLALTMLPPEGVRLAAEPLPDWKATGEWYERLAHGREEPTSAVRAAAAAAFQGVGDDPYDRILEAAGYVRDKVRYIAREVGIGGYRPHPAEQVAKELVGDCKDKGTLLRGILAADGRRSYPLIVNASFDGTVSDAVPSLAAFNHFVVAVELPGDRPVPAGLAPAVFDGEGLGKLLVIDTTNEYLTPGAVSASLAGKRALLVAGDQSRIVTLPGLDASAHRIERTFEAEVQADGSVQWRRISRNWGEPATECRAAHRQGAEERRRAVEAWVAERWPGARVGTYAADAETADGAFVETVTWTSPPASMLDVFPGTEEDIPRVPVARRTGPVVYEYPRSLRYAVTVKGARDSGGAPALEASGEGWSARRTTSLEAGALTAVWEVRLERIRYEVEETAALKALWSGLRKTSNMVVEVGK